MLRARADEALVFFIVSGHSVTAWDPSRVVPLRLRRNATVVPLFQESYSCVMAELQRFSCIG